MSEDWLRRDLKKQDKAFLINFLLCMLVGIPWLYYLAEFSGISFAKVVLQDPVVFALSDVFLGFGFAVVGWNTYRKTMRKQGSEV